jgi:hypothetical protein
MCDMTTVEKRANATPACFADWVAQQEAAIAAATTDTTRGTVRTAITSTTAAIDAAANTLRGTSTSSSAHLEDILYLERAVKKKEEEILIAKDRAAAARASGQPPSYYESWFPLGRPMKPALVPIFTAAALFLLLVAGMFAASLFGYTATVLYPAPRLSFATGPSLIGRFFSLFPTSFWVLLIIAGAAIYYLFYVRPQKIAEEAVAAASKSA